MALRLHGSFVACALLATAALGVLTAELLLNPASTSTPSPTTGTVARSLSRQCRFWQTDAWATSP